MLVSLPSAAERLGVDESRVRQRIADGSLRAEKIGGRWLLDDADLIGIDERPAGRPLSAASAWALIGAASAQAARAQGRDDPGAAALLDRVAPGVRSRSRARLKDLLAQVQVEPSGHAAEDWAARAARHLRILLRNRAVRSAYAASARDLDDLRADSRFQLSGLSLPESGIAAGGIVEGYVREDGVGSLSDDYLLVAARERDANVFLHVVSKNDPQLWPAVSDAVGSHLVLAADLAEHRRPREEARAADLLHLLADLGHG